MRWHLSWRADPRARALADRHYNRQSVGADQFVPPGTCIVLLTPEAGAFWVTSWPLAAYVQHAWSGAWMCSAFRNERRDLYLSSELVREAVAATRWRYGDPPELGMVTFVDPTQTRRKRDPGRCFLRAGFKTVGTTKGGLLALQLSNDDCPPAHAPLGAQLDLAVGR
jgi:hypothetical protein